MAIRLNILGEKHIDTAQAYNNLGYTYKRLSDYNKALENYIKALDIRMELLREFHPKIIQSYTNIAMSYKESFNYCKALDFFQKAVSAKLITYGENHSETAHSYYQIAECHSSMHLFLDAITYYEKAKEIYLKNNDTQSTWFVDQGIDQIRRNHSLELNKEKYYAGIEAKKKEAMKSKNPFKRLWYKIFY